MCRTTTVAIRRVGFRAVLSLAGRVEESATHDFVDAFANAIEQGAQEIWLDLSRVTALHGRALEGITRVVELGHEVERRTVVVCPPGPICRALYEAGVDDYAEIHESLTAAQRAG